MNAVIRKFLGLIVNNRLIIIAFSAFIIYYELTLYRSCFCENKKLFLNDCNFSNTDRKKNLTFEKSNTFTRLH